MEALVKGFGSFFNLRGLGYFAAFFLVWMVLAMLEWRPEDVAARIGGMDSGTG